jgi:hypothetical protein
MVYILLLVAIEHLLREEGSRCHGEIREVFLEDIGCAHDTLRLSTSDESVGSHTGFTEDVTRYGEYVSSVVECELCGDEGSTFYSCLWYDDAIREGCYHLVPDREHIGLSLSTDGEYRYESSSSLEYRIKKLGILYGIVDIDTTAEYRYRISTTGERDLMRYRIDPVGPTAHDTTSSLHQIGDDILEHLLPIARVASGSDDPEHLAFLMEISSDIEEIGCLLDGAESLRVAI